MLRQRSEFVAREDAAHAPAALVARIGAPLLAAVPRMRSDRRGTGVEYLRRLLLPLEGTSVAAHPHDSSLPACGEPRRLLGALSSIAA